MLVVVLPDGSPGMVALDATDVLGPRDDVGEPATMLSVTGVRRLRSMIAVHQARGVPMGRKRRARTWKVVAHRLNVDPFQGAVRVYSWHTTETAATRACARLKATAARDLRARVRISVVHDPANTLVVRAAPEDNR